MAAAMKGKEEETRVRKYGLTYKGEIVVLIRAGKDENEMEIPLKPLKIHKFIFGNFRYISRVTQVNQHKIKVEFHESAKSINTQPNVDIQREAAFSDGDSERIKALKEANTLAKLGIKNCHVYIPAKYSEVQGVISWPIGEDLEDFKTNSKGIFNNSVMLEVNVINIVRLKKKSNEATNVQLEDTSIVIITFEGVLLPDKLKCDRLIIPVREYRRREMFCTNCKKYSHTQKFCNNRKLENPHFLCMQCMTNDHIGGSTQCPRRKILEKKSVMTLRQLRKKTFAEILNELDPTGEVHQTASQTASTSAPLIFPSRKQEVAAKKLENKSTTKAPQKVQAPTQRPPSATTANKYPPGFQKPKTNSTAQQQQQQPNQTHEEIIISEAIKEFLSDFNIPDALQQIIVKFCTPYIDKFIQYFINTIEKKLCSLFGN